MKCVQTLCLILALAAAVPLCNACTPASWAVAKASDPPLNLSATAFTQDQVLEALQGWGSWTGRFQDPTRTTWACVDSRSSTTHHQAYATLETAGGDMSEVTALIIAYHRIKQMQPTEETVRAILHAFINQIATPARPFYYHTADDKLQHALAEFTNLTGRVVVSLPNREPADARERDAWYEALTSVDSQGCGHIRQILLHPTDYDLRSPAEVSTPQWAIKAFYRYWWPTRDGSTQRRKVYLPVLQGTLAARALAIVNNEGPGCPGLEPDLAPFHGGSSMFLYHGNGVAAFRSRVLVPFITRLDPSVDGAALLTELTSLQDTHLAATIRLLAPLNALPIWTADLTTSYVKK